LPVYVNETIITQSGIGCFIECFVVQNFLQQCSTKTGNFANWGILTIACFHFHTV